MYHKRARVWGCERIQGVSWIYDSLEVIPSSFRKEIRYNRILFSFYWNCRTIFVARSFQFFNTGIFLIIYSVDVAWRVKTFFEILGVFRNMSVEIWRGCPLYVAATSNLNVHISKLGGWKIYIYIYYTGEALFRKRFNVLFSAYTIMQVIYYSISGQEKRKNWSISLSLISQFILNR